VRGRDSVEPGKEHRSENRFHRAQHSFSPYRRTVLEKIFFLSSVIFASCRVSLFPPCSRRGGLYCRAGRRSLCDSAPSESIGAGFASNQFVRREPPLRSAHRPCRGPPLPLAQLRQGSAPVTAETIIAGLKNAMAGPSDRHGYLEATKLIDGIDPKNIAPSSTRSRCCQISVRNRSI
jgi:hypothetical protein